MFSLFYYHMFTYIHHCLKSQLKSQHKSPVTVVIHLCYRGIWRHEVIYGSVCLFLVGNLFTCLHARTQFGNYKWKWKFLFDNELSSPRQCAKQPEASEQSSNSNSWKYKAADKHVNIVLKHTGIVLEDRVVRRITRFCKLYKCGTRWVSFSIPSLWECFMGCGKMCVWALWLSIRGHLMAHSVFLWDPGRAPVVTAYVDVSPAIESCVREYRSELLCCGIDTLRHRERSVPDIWRRVAGKRWHRGGSHEKVSLCQRVEKQPT